MQGHGDALGAGMGGGEAELVAAIGERWAEGSVAGKALGTSFLGSQHPDTPFAPIGEACWWTTHPASKQRSEGEKVRVGDDLILVSVSSERYLVSNPLPPPSGLLLPPGLGAPRQPISSSGLPVLRPQLPDSQFPGS